MTIWKPAITCYYDYTGIARRLERLARRGWKLVGMGAFGWKLQNIAPTQLHYNVVYFPDISDQDPQQPQNLQEYIAFCEDAGWALAAQKEQMLIFCSEENDPVPIDTDPVVQVETIHKVMKKNYFRGYITILLLAAIQLWKCWDAFNTGGVYFWANSASLLRGVWWPILVLMVAVDGGTYFLWHRKALRAAEEGRFTDSGSAAWAQRLELLVVFGGLAAIAIAENNPIVYLSLGVVVLITLAVFGLNSLLQQSLKNWGMDALGNRMVMVGVMSLVLFTCIMVFGIRLGEWSEKLKQQTAVGYVALDEDLYYYYDDALPLTLSDLGIDSGENPYTHVSERMTSSLMEIQFGIDRHVLYWLDENEALPELSYTVVIPKVDWLQDYAFREMYKNYHDPVRTDASLWGAERAYVQKSASMGQTYLLTYPNRVVQLYTNFNLTDEQIQIVVDALKGGAES